MGKTLLETADLIQEMHRGIEGVKKAPYLKEYPRGELNSMDFPLVLVYPETAQWSNPFGMGCKSERRSWRVVCIIASPNEGVMFEALEKAVKLIDEIGKTYNDASNTIMTESDGNLLIEITDEFPNDSGFDDELVHADTIYYGFTFNLLVWRKA